jgi:hypothetical protein
MQAPPSEAHCRWIEHGGIEILELDLRGCSGEESARRHAVATSFIATLPEQSVLCLTQAAGARYDPRHIPAIVSGMRANAPYLVASAIVGLDHLTKVVNVLNRLSGRRLRAFDDVESAVAWLASTKSGPGDPD